MARSQVWREEGGVLKKRCPTCEERGRAPWHSVDMYSYDKRRKHNVAIRCLQCNREDNQYYYTEAIDRGEPWNQAPRTDDRRQQEREWFHRRMQNPEKRAALNERQREYYAERVAQGWRFVAGKWIEGGKGDA